MPDLVDRLRLRLFQMACGVEGLRLEEEADLIAGFLKIGVAGMGCGCGREDGGMRLGIEILHQGLGPALEVVAERRRDESSTTR